ncbi:hypothetical protein C8F04DRAFT_1200288 [Mycena alexandri]|uniref:Uncharacterized protein n=1 Tax=Mycena alexandri TaxID=1745969 RepID=A0AAD6WNA8_9AGAR|nr:hypothetical protein C8F04DRAFT_1200288 [Mycena alexandri]
MKIYIGTLKQLGCFSTSSVLVTFLESTPTSAKMARDQVNGFSNGRWKKAATHSEAITVWNDLCELYHSHSPSPSYSTSPPSPSVSPSPSPPPSPSSPPPRGLGRGSSPAGSGRGLGTSTRRAARAPNAPTTRYPESHHPSLPVVPRRPALETLHAAAPSRMPPRTARSIPAGASPGPSSLPAPRTTAGRHSARRPSPRPSASIMQVESERNPREWRVGDRLWGIQGTPLVFEDRYAVIDYMFARRLSPAYVMETRNRRKLEAFVEVKEYSRAAGDPEDSE